MTAPLREPREANLQRRVPARPPTAFGLDDEVPAERKIPS